MFGYNCLPLLLVMAVGPSLIKSSELCHGIQNNLPVEFMCKDDQTCCGSYYSRDCCAVYEDLITTWTTLLAVLGLLIGFALVIAFMVFAVKLCNPEQFCGGGLKKRTQAESMNMNPIR